MITEKDEIEQLKRELKSYNYYVESVREINMKLIEINTKLIGLSSPTPSEVIAGKVSVKYYHDNKMELMDEEAKLITERSYYEGRIAKINSMLDEMNRDSQKLIKGLFMEHISYATMCEELRTSESSLKRRVNSIIKETIKK